MTLNDEVKLLIERQVSEGRQIGLQVCAYQRGKMIVDAWAGRMGPNDLRPVNNDCTSSAVGQPVKESPQQRYTFSLTKA
jgi:hypothetical protein